ncbi:MAG: serine hydrolase [Gemmatimonadales bacterium]
MRPFGDAVAFTLVFVANVAAQAPAPAVFALRPEFSRQIDSLYAPYTKPPTVGGVVVVIHRGQVIHLKGYGAAQREFGVPWTPDTRYRLASITKSLVATAVLRLEDQGKVRLTDPVRRYLPDLPDMGAPVTIDHLLTMSSGLWQDETLLALAGLRGSLTVDEMYQLSTRQRRLNFPPGSSMAYTDTNYRILARVIAAVTGRSFWDAMQDLVFRPLGMTSSLADPSLHHFYDNQAPTYLGGPDDPAPPLVNVPFHTSGDGSAITTMRDFIHWLLELRRDHEKPGSLFERMTRPFNLGDGMPAGYRRGIAVFPHRGLIGWAHGGFTGTHYVFYPELDLIIANFTNQLGGLSPNSVDIAVTDLFLAAEGYPSGDVSRAMAQAEPATGPVSAAETRLLSGVFVEPGAGYVFGSDPVAAGSRDQPFIRFDYLGTEVRVAKAAEGRFATPALQRGARLTIAPVPCGGCLLPDLDVRQAGWPAPRRFRRVTTVPAVRAKDYVGVYHLAALDAYYTVAEEPKGLVLRIAAGVQASQVLPLTALGPDLFWGSSMDGGQFDLYALGKVSIKFTRGPSGRVTGMRFTVDRVRDLELVKVR